MSWDWDRTSFTNLPTRFSCVRWRRGPVTFYRYVLDLGEGRVTTQWWVYVADNTGIGVHVPNWFARLFS